MGRLTLKTDEILWQKDFNNLYLCQYHVINNIRPGNIIESPNWQSCYFKTCVMQERKNEYEEALLELKEENQENDAGMI